MQLAASEALKRMQVADVERNAILDTFRYGCRPRTPEAPCGPCLQQLFNDRIGPLDCHKAGSTSRGSRVLIKQVQRVAQHLSCWSELSR